LQPLPFFLFPFLSFIFLLSYLESPHLFSSSGCAKRGLPVELFGHPSNARFFKNWKFAPALDALPQTEAVISCTLDVRMPLSWEEKDFEDMYSVLKEAIADAGLL